SSLENNYYDIISMSYLFLSCTEILFIGRVIKRIFIIIKELLNRDVSSSDHPKEGEFEGFIT
ncbi:hypothetical protein, partial [Acinetobacter baumannii]